MSPPAAVYFRSLAECRVSPIIRSSEIFEDDFRISPTLKIGPS